MAERWRDDLDGFLTDVREKTEDISARPALVDRVMTAVSSGQAEPDAELMRLAQATEDLAPPAGLTDRVMSEVRAAPRSIAPQSGPMSTSSRMADNLSRTGLKAMGVFAAVAAVCILFSTYAERTLDTRLISTIDSVEGGE
jgi:hypothetical protein